MNKPLIVQTGSVPALLWLLRRHADSAGALVVALDAENVRQYLREIPGLEVRYFRDNRDAEKILRECGGFSPVSYFGGSAFPVLRRTVRRLFPDAAEVTPEHSAEWGAFLDDFNRSVRRDSVLLIQTADSQVIEDYLKNVFRRHELARPSINILCTEDEAPRWRALHHEWRYWTVPRRKKDFLALAVELRRQKFDAAIAFFTGDRKYNSLKPLLLASGARQKIVLNEHMQFLPARWGSLLYLNWQSMRHRWTRKELDRTVTRVLFIQTWDAERTFSVLRRLQDVSPFYKPKYTLLTREDHAGAFAGAPLIDEVLTYPETQGWRGHLKTLRALRERCFDGAVVTFTEEPSFRKLKLLPFILPVRYKLVFNRHYDCFFFTPARFLRYAAKLCAHAYERLWRQYGRDSNRVLVVQTWDDEKMEEIMLRLPHIDAFYKPRYSMLVREDKAALFAKHAWIEEFITYPRAGSAMDYWKCVRSLRSKKFDAAVLALTERPTYRKWKWIPFLAGIPSRLIFNRHLDCFFFSPRSFLRYWVQRYFDDISGAQASIATIPELLWSLFLPLIRGILFPMRFLYLVTSITLRKVARAYTVRRPMN